MELKLIPHRFLQYPIDPNIETLIIGTFNPETEKNPAEIFYGRSRNHLWKLLPLALGAEDLKGKDSKDKLDFIKKHKVGFIDLVAEVRVDAGSETNYGNDYIDSRVTKWRDVISEMKKMKRLKKVCFTRKTFSGIPQVKERVIDLEHYCKRRQLPFQCLSTPARIYSKSKQEEWTNFFSGSANS